MTKDIPVIFRKDNDGDIVALFPTMPAGKGKTSCMGFTLEHGLISTDIGLMRLTVEADMQEYQRTLAEIVHEGFYPLDICKRVMGYMNDTRLKASTKEAKAEAGKKVVQKYHSMRELVAA